MNDLLTPPPLRDLPPQRARQLREDLVELAAAEQHAPRRGRWILAVAAAAAIVIAVVFGAQAIRPLVAVNPTPASSPSALPNSPSPSAPPSAPAGKIVQDDQGQLSSAEAEQLATQCREKFPFSGGQPGRIDLALTSRSLGPVVWLSTSDRAHICNPATRNYNDVDGLPAQPTTQHPVRVVVNSADTQGSSQQPTFTVEALLAVTTTDDVDYVLLRVRSEGKTSPWFRGDAHGGHAMVGASMTVTGDSETAGIESETKAFTRDGREVPIT